MTDARRMEWDTMNSSLTKRGRAGAREGEHLIRRSVTKGEDQVLGLGVNGSNEGELTVATHEYTIIKSHGDYHCECGEDFGSDLDAAHDHLRAAQEGSL